MREQFAALVVVVDFFFPKKFIQYELDNFAETQS